MRGLSPLPPGEDGSWVCPPEPGPGPKEVGWFLGGRRKHRGRESRRFGSLVGDMSRGDGRAFPLQGEAGHALLPLHRPAAGGPLPYFPGPQDTLSPSRQCGAALGNPKCDGRDGLGLV